MMAKPIQSSLLDLDYHAPEAKMAIQLYSWPRSSGTRVSWALEELGLLYEYVELDAKQGEQRSAGHLVRHPQGKVPALVDGERSFFESGAILLHLGETYGVSRHLWPAAGSPEHAGALSWTVWASVELGRHMIPDPLSRPGNPLAYQAGGPRRPRPRHSPAQPRRRPGGRPTRPARGRA